ncbi:basement membrane-specific heparan sulfate proteoglycan core protein-like [Ornithodoros turicata]|uniref:basement membrane-specific heparan sulfate proteoglycan core protein-like n=1 Tax=Ornithodoros turicata TaxID=34597 RepID=UPI00313A2EBB
MSLQCRRSSAWINVLGIGVLLWASREVRGGKMNIKAVAGQSVELPCNVSVTSKGNWAASLVLWYKDNASTPLYTLDVRSGDVSRARHFPAAAAMGRAIYDVSRMPTVLRLGRVEPSDEGNYRCRVDYRQSRTEHHIVALYVIVPPKEVIIVDEYGQRLVGVVGPYNQGSTIRLICDAEGGSPLPQVTWWKGGNLVDDSYAVQPQGYVRNELHYGPLNRSDYMAELQCRGSNTDMAPSVTSGVSLDINLKPVLVKISSTVHPVSAGKAVKIRCRVEGARPHARIAWFKGNERLLDVRDVPGAAQNYTLSTVSFIASSKDHGLNVTCRADNPSLPKSDISDGTTLNVQYTPRVFLSSGSTTLREGDDVLLHCAVDANPPATRIAWHLGGTLIRNATGENLQLRAVSKKDNSDVKCSAVNSEGNTSSNTLRLTVVHPPECKTSNVIEHSASYGEIVRIPCDVDANPDEVHFDWLFNTTERTRRIKSFTINGTRSVATLIPNGKSDYGFLLCWASNAVGRQKDPCAFRLVQAGPPAPPQNCTTRVHNYETVFVQCKEGYTGGLPPTFHIELYSAMPEELLANVTSTKQPHFKLSGLRQGSFYKAVVYASNVKGRSSNITLHYSVPQFNASLLYKEDRPLDVMSPLYGFLIGATVFLSCALILFFATKHCRRVQLQKDKRRPSTADKCSQDKECLELSSEKEFRSPDIICEQYAVQASTMREASIQSSAEYEFEYDKVEFLSPLQYSTGTTRKKSKWKSSDVKRSPTISGCTGSYELTEWTGSGDSLHHCTPAAPL